MLHHRMIKWPVINMHSVSLTSWTERRKVLFSKMNSSIFALGYVKHTQRHTCTHEHTLLDLIDIVLRYFVFLSVSLSLLLAFFPSSSLSSCLLPFILSVCVACLGQMNPVYTLTRQVTHRVTLIHQLILDRCDPIRCASLFLSLSLSLSLLCFTAYFTMQVTCLRYCIYLRQ